MDYLHIKNIEKYHPKYKDRQLTWCKTYFSMINADPEFELLDEIDKWRFVCFVMLELQLKKEVPLDDQYLSRKGFNLKIRPISKTIQMLHTLVEIRTKTVTHIILDKEIEGEGVTGKPVPPKDPLVDDFFAYYLLKTKTKFRLTPDKKALILSRLQTGYTIDQLKLAVDNFIKDPWEDRKKHLDLIYCIGKQRGKPDSLEKWLNFSVKTGWRTP